MQLGNIVINTIVFEEKLKQGVKQHKLIEGVAELNINKVEIRREYIKDYTELDSIKSMAEKFEMEIFYSVPELLFSGEMMSKDELKALFEECNRMGASHLKMTGGYAKSIKQEDVDFIQKLKQQYPLITLTIENDQVASYSTGDKLLKLAKTLNNKGANISITFDIGNFIYVEEDPVENAKKLSELVSIIHLKDVKRNPLQTTFIGQGDIPICTVVSYLPENLDVVLEYPCGDYPLEVLKQELNKIVEKERV